MTVLDDLGMTPADLREAVGDRGGAGHASFLVPPAPENTEAGRAAIRRDRAAKQGRAARDAVALGRPSAGASGDVDVPDAAVEGVLGERLDGALRFREVAVQVVEAAEAAGQAVDGGPLLAMAERAVGEAEAAYDMARLPRPGASRAFRDFLAESGDDLKAMRARAREEV